MLVIVFVYIRLAPSELKKPITSYYFLFKKIVPGPSSFLIYLKKKLLFLFYVYYNFDLILF